MPERTSIGTLQELIQILKDRALLYHHALMDIAHSGRFDLKTIFGQLIRESLLCLQELTDYLAHLDGRTNGEDQALKGAIYRTWETRKTPIEGNCSKAILELCEQESEALGHAYEAALSAPALDNHLKRRLNRHILMIHDSETSIRTYHDAL